MKTSTLAFLASCGALTVSLGSGCNGFVVVDSGNGNGAATSASSTVSNVSAGGSYAVTNGAYMGEGGSPPSTGSDTTAGSTTVASSSSTSGGDGGAVTSGTGGGNPSGGGPGACSPSKQATVWAKMDVSPVVPPTQAALLNLAGLTDQIAEEILCPGTMLGDMFGDMSSVEAWGDSQEVWLDYATSTGAASMMTLWPGYLGTLDFLSADGANKYQIGVNVQISKNGAPFTLTWDQGPTFDAQVDELYQGLAATFGGGAAEPPGTNCVTGGQCVSGSFGDVGYVYFKPLGISIWVASISQPQPTPSIPNRFDLILP